MGTVTKIQWTDHTFNPWIGCSKVSPGCANCYAEALMDRRMGKAKWGPGGTRVRTSSANWREPVRWNRDAQQAGVRRKVFCASLADIYEDHPAIDPQWRVHLFNLIQMTPHLDWLLLTKRPENIARLSVWSDTRKPWPDNVWLGTSVENQEQADKRIPLLLDVPARVHFLSMEPLLGPVTLPDEFLAIPEINGPLGFGGDGDCWVIVGGESGPVSRPMDPAWARSLRDQCHSHGVPFFFKQWGGVNKEEAGHLLDGVEHHAFPGGAQ